MGCGKYPSDWGSISDGHGIELYYVFDEESDAVTLAQSLTHSLTLTQTRLPALDPSGSEIFLSADPCSAIPF